MSGVIAFVFPFVSPSRRIFCCNDRPSQDSHRLAKFDGRMVGQGLDKDRQAGSRQPVLGPARSRRAFIRRFIAALPAQLSCSLLQEQTSQESDASSALGLG